MIDHTKESIGKSKPSKIIPLLKIIAKHWGLNLSRQKQFDTSKRILINSAKKN